MSGGAPDNQTAAAKTAAAARRLLIRLGVVERRRWARSGNARAELSAKLRRGGGTAAKHLGVATVSLFRQLLFRLRLIERRHRAAIRQNANGLLARFTHSSLFSLNANPLRRGLAIGMFWAFVPMPFQMAPATLFCLLGYANLPIALVCVWISNPLTYIPIFYAQYKIGVWLYATEAQQRALSHINFEYFSDFYDSSIAFASDFFIFLLKGGLTTAVLFGVVGYAAGYPFSAYLRRHSKKRWKKKKYANEN